MELPPAPSSLVTFCQGTGWPGPAWTCPDGEVACRYELHHGVRISDSALVDAAVMSDRYIADRFLPDKARPLAVSRLACAALRVVAGCGWPPVRLVSGWCTTLVAGDAVR